MKRRKVMTLDAIDGHTIEEKNVDKNAKEKSSRQQFLYVISLASELGFAISVPVSIGAVGGWLLDRKFSTTPKLTLLLLFIGIIISATTIARVVKKMSRDAKTK